ncbi:TIGR03364 family FAD-dependent oxidoreductase [Rhabdobacter roseus]|uniref:FAD dependent oxidoreductase TIGR03364 n=1 Tax=Rhabdobacter roseus TaxID=1655419 RepID=A0A840TLC9_9BACT|nr:TIGR03364 family FAD-dependent oxidoreductase [Rhabdobacter roseus]MBB5284224.1 FAD dependent oxidoreductase TIGR03364 [Rhabdobacter roseus]
MKSFDLIVVGAGILGTSHALQAARRGLKVLLLEKDNRPVSATVRNFGQVVPSGLAGRWFEYGRRGVQQYKAIQAQYDISVRPHGSVYVASDAAEWQLAQEAAELFRAKDYPCVLLSATETLAKYPFLKVPYVRGGIFFPDDVSVEPDRLVHRLIEYAQQQHGVKYLSHTAVLDCQPYADHVEVLTARRERFEAGRVMVCSGSEFRLLFPEVFAQSGLVVSKLQMLQTAPLPQLHMQGNVLTGLTLRRYESFEECPSFASLSTPAHYEELKKWGVHILFKQALDGSVIIGDSHEYASATQTDDLGFDLKEPLNELMLAEAERIVQFPVRGIARSWAGYYAQHPDEIYEHDLAPHLHIITGIGGKGMTSSLGYAEAKVADWR